MDIIRFQRNINCEVRRVIPKISVPGYSKVQTEIYPELICFIRGNIRYCFDSDFNCFFKTKVDSPYKYLPVTYDDFHKFFDIESTGIFDDDNKFIPYDI